MFNRFVSSVSQLLFRIDCTIFIFDSIDTFLSKNDNAVDINKCTASLSVILHLSSVAASLEVINSLLALILGPDDMDKGSLFS
jgi:hypothetical protein